ncbi:M20/M25/M40 family metallo-hydrolase [Bacillus lacus]|uniref:M20/M25/M40 family metallo-hydrolase n=1 Tax=Metabacillus lacus TaxID=1983721 RepID=A0A7X2J2I8_9BACI|nr:M20/M25/M40 family metallo-hydrolase [Metabacillus lacus]MRX74283.1 M20/M25/M40 family metallo-hydrolase [Metabacillus lacus]
MNNHWQTKEQLTDLLVKLVEHDSITGTAGEVAFAEYLFYILKDTPYYQENPDHLSLHPLQDGRYFLTALVKKAKKKNTAILLSHFDVVDIIDYGDLKHLAFRPRELTSEYALRMDMIPEYVQQDLKSGEWLFGRGTMDMKAGLTAQISILERAMNGEFDGNVMLLTVPDEEVNSAGMINAVPVLSRLKDEYDLSYQACINSEPMFSRFPNDPNYYVYTGSIGKVLAGFYCFGTETHVGEPFSGLNANYMASEVNRFMELNEDYCEAAGNEVSPPPTNLMQKDLKEEYSVQIPHTAVSLFNVFLMKRSAKELHSLLTSSAKQAAENIEKHYRRKAEAFSRVVAFQPSPVEVSVYSYEELYQLAVDKAGKSEVERRINYLIANRGVLGDRDFSTRIVSEVAGLCKEHSPMIVVFYSPPFYPAVSSEGDELIEEAVKQVTDYTKKEYGITLKKQNYFQGLSDLSFLQLSPESSPLDSFVGNMPLFGRPYRLPLQEMKELNLPVMNLGPVGRDAHKWTERVHLPYTFSILPDQLSYTLKWMFEK